MVVPSLRVAFFGTPSFACATLRQLAASNHPVVLVVTQPDRPRGRGKKVAPSPVKAFALEQGLPVLQPDRLRDPAFLVAFDAHLADISVVAAYGRILPEDLLSRPPLGTINVHASLLPRWRGAAPVNRAVLSGDHETGITIMRVVAALDAGPTLAQERVAIGPNDTSDALEARLAEIGGRLLVNTVDRLASGPVPEHPQPGVGVTYASRLERHERRVDWERPAEAIHNQIRGLRPWPVATVLFHGRRLLLLGSEVSDRDRHHADPGTVSAVSADAIIVAARPGAVRITRVQPEGRPAMSVRQFLVGHPVAPGDRFESVPEAHE